LVLAPEPGELLVAGAPVAGEGAGAAAGELALPAVDEAVVDAEVAGRLSDAAGALGGADGLELVLAGEGSSGGHGRVPVCERILLTGCPAYPGQVTETPIREAAAWAEAHSDIGPTYLSR